MKFYHLRMSIIILLVSSCARMQTLGTIPYKYSEPPKRILWIQLPGFSEEQVALLKLMPTSKDLELEKMRCLGKMWNYSIYKLRPQPFDEMLIQLSGLRNVTNYCEMFKDTSNKNIFDILNEGGFETAVLESNISGSNIQSMADWWQCNNGTKINTKLYTMNKTSGNEFFHFQDLAQDEIKLNKSNSENASILYDRSCQKNNDCISTLEQNFIYTWNQLNIKNPNNFLLLRDLNLYKSLMKKDVVGIKESLREIESIIKLVNENNTLVVITSASPIGVEIPNEGSEMKNFDNGSNLNSLLYSKRAGVMSVILAKGPKSENFCGVFDETDLLKRLFHHVNRKNFSLDYINPF